MCTFSVVTVVFNDADRIVETISSVAEQDIDDVQHIIIDGLSSDGTLTLIQKFPHLDVISERDEGIFDAMNKGLARARNDYVIFMNAGDSFFNGSVLREVRDFIAGCPDRCPAIVYGDTWEFDRRNPDWGEYKKSRRSSMIKYGMVCHHQAIFYSTHYLTKNNIRYDLSYVKASDYALTSRIIADGATIQQMPLCVCRYDICGVSQTHYSSDMSEPFRIKVDLLKVNSAVAFLIVGIQFMINALKKHFPGIYHFLRYHACDWAKK